MFNPKTFARVFKNYYAENNLCEKCGGSLTSCHDKTTEKE